MPRSDAVAPTLSDDVLAALRRAQRAHEEEAAECLLQALEALARRDVRDEALRKAYLRIPITH